MSLINDVKHGLAITFVILAIRTVSIVISSGGYNLNVPTN